MFVSPRRACDGSRLQPPLSRLYDAHRICRAVLLLHSHAYLGRPATDQLSLVYTPAYDPDANRIEWLWRISRRIVTHNHHRKDFETLLADARTHFETLSRTPDDLLRHIGSPFAPDKRPNRSQANAA